MYKYIYIHIYVLAIIYWPSYTSHNIPAATYRPSYIGHYISAITDQPIYIGQYILASKHKRSPQLGLVYLRI